MRQKLSHFTNFEDRHIIRIPTNQQHEKSIYQALVEKGAQTHCHILSESPELDKQILPLNIALNEIVGSGIGTLIGCIPGQLGYYEGEELSERFFLIN